MELTQSILKEYLTYQEKDGGFVWRVGRGRVKQGKKAGTTHIEGYRQIRIAGKCYREHRLVWLYVKGHWPYQIDHINGIRDDNRIENLRDVPQSENSKNRGRSKNNTSGFNGVHWDSRCQKWRAQIKVNYKPIILGHFKNIDDAVKARKKAEERYGFHQNHGVER